MSGAPAHGGPEIENAKLRPQDRRLFDLRQASQPVEQHWPLADDKMVLFEIAPTHRLVGTWQGPGSIAELRRAGGRRP